MRIADDVLAVLSAVRCDGRKAVLTGALDRKLYVRTNDVLEAAGGKWNRGAKAHVFEGEAAEALDAVIVAGEIVTKKTLQQQFGYFPTPAALVARLLAMAEVHATADVLEPSAGKGAISSELLKITPNVYVCELLSENNVVLANHGYWVHRIGDFLTDMAPGKEQTFDRVVMNPPFAMQADIKHVTHALRFLKPGGVLVSVMSAGVAFRQDKRTQQFHELIKGFDSSIDALPDNSFKESGTGVSTVVLKVQA